MKVNRDKHGVVVTYHSVGQEPTKPLNLVRLEKKIGKFSHHLQSDNPDLVKKLQALFAYIEFTLFENTQITLTTKEAVRAFLQESVTRCTDGLLVELEAIVVWLRNSKSLRSYLQQLREDIVIKVANEIFTNSETTQPDVYQLATVFKIASSNGYGVPPRNEVALHINYWLERYSGAISDSLSKAFEKKYAPIPIVCSLMEMLESTVASILSGQSLVEPQLSTVYNLICDFLEISNLKKEDLYVLDDNCVPIAIDWLAIQALLWKKLVADGYFIGNNEENLYVESLLAGSHSVSIQLDLDRLLRGDLVSLFKYHSLEFKMGYLRSKAPVLCSKLNTSPQQLPIAFLTLLTQLNASLNLAYTTGGSGQLGTFMSEILPEGTATELVLDGARMLQQAANRHSAALVPCLHFLSGFESLGGMQVVFDAMELDSQTKMRILMSLPMLEEKVRSALLTRQKNRNHMLTDAVFLTPIPSSTVLDLFSKLPGSEKQSVIWECLTTIASQPLTEVLVKRMVMLLKSLLLDLTDEQYFLFLKKVRSHFVNLRPLLFEAINHFNQCRQVELYITTLKFLFEQTIPLDNRLTESIEELLSTIFFLDLNNKIKILCATLRHGYTLLMLTLLHLPEFLPRLVSFVEENVPVEDRINLFRTKTRDNSNLLLLALADKNSASTPIIIDFLSSLPIDHQKEVLKAVTTDGYTPLLYVARFKPYYLPKMLEIICRFKDFSLFFSTFQEANFLTIVLCHHPFEVIKTLSHIRYFSQEDRGNLVSENCRLLLLQQMAVSSTEEIEDIMYFIQSLHPWKQVDILWAKGGYFHEHLMRITTNMFPLDDQSDDLFVNARAKFASSFRFHLMENPESDQSVLAIQRLCDRLEGHEDNNPSFFAKKPAANLSLDELIQRAVASDTIYTRAFRLIDWPLPETTLLVDRAKP